MPFFFFSFSFLRVLRFVERRIFHPSKSYPVMKKETRLNYNVIGEEEEIDRREADRSKLRSRRWI